MQLTRQTPPPFDPRPPPPKSGPWNPGRAFAKPRSRAQDTTVSRPGATCRVVWLRVGWLDLRVSRAHAVPRRLSNVDLAATPIIVAPESPRTCVCWRPSVARFPGPRRAKSSASSRALQVAPSQCPPPARTNSASGPQSSARSCADDLIEQTGSRLRPGPTRPVPALQNVGRDSSR